jgi:hypothetical protein
MPRRPGQALRIGVAADTLTLVRTARWWGEPVSVLAEQRVDTGAGPAALAGALAALLGGHDIKGWPVSFIVADDFARLWEVTPPPAAARLADLQAAAALRFFTLFGESTAAWQLEAGWDATHGFVAAALPRGLLALLCDGARAHGLHVVGIAPQFIAGWNQWRGALKPGMWYGQVHGGVLTLGVTEHARLRAVRAAAVPASADGAWLGQHLAREALRLDCPLPSRIALSGQLPDAWRHTASAGPVVCAALAGARDWSAGAHLAPTGSTA